MIELYNNSIRPYCGILYIIICEFHKNTHLSLLVLEGSELRPASLRHSPQSRVVWDRRIERCNILCDGRLILELFITTEAILRDKSRPSPRTW